MLNKKNVIGHENESISTRLLRFVIPDIKIGVTIDSRLSNVTTQEE